MSLTVPSAPASYLDEIPVKLSPLYAEFLVMYLLPVASERDVLGSACPPNKFITKKYAIPAALMKNTNVLF